MPRNRCLWITEDTRLMIMNIKKKKKYCDTDINIDLDDTAYLAST